MSNKRTLYFAGMGTAVKYAIDLSATLPKENTRDAINNSVYWEFIEKRFLKSTQIDPDQLEDTMDKLLEQYERESMKTKILKHEEIFKDQVRELHRLYKVQKMLMAEFRNDKAKPPLLTNPSPRPKQVEPNCIDMDKRTILWSNAASFEANHSHFSKWNHPSNHINSVYNFHQLLSLRADPSLQEESSSCSRDAFRMCRGFDLERPAEEDISADLPNANEEQTRPRSLRSSKDKMSINSSFDTPFSTDVESEVELTLGIGFGTCNKKKAKNHQPYSSLELGCTASKNNETRQMDPSMLVRSDQG